MLKKAYVEITNICNLKCTFCHGTSRAPAFMQPQDFLTIAKKLREHTGYIYLHILGEPLLHPKLNELLKICSELKFKVTIVTNGMLIEKAAAILNSADCLYKICFSLHSFEANEKATSFENYLEGICSFADESSKNGVINVLKLWNGGGQNSLNEKILEYIKNYFGCEIKEKIKSNIYLDFADKFAWPDKGEKEQNPRFCMGLRDQIGVLVDGTAVPCCLDAEGTINLGNLLTDEVYEILNSERAKSIVNGFSQGRAAEELCRKCDFAKRHFG